MSIFNNTRSPSDRELMQMALDALEEAWNYGYTHTSVSNALSERLCQPDWVGLTDEEREQILYETEGYSFAYAKNIEAKLKEKNT